MANINAASHRWAWRTLSIRARLAVITAIGVIATLTAANAVLSQLFERHVTQQFQAALTVSLNQLAASIDADVVTGRIKVREPAGDPRWSKPYSGLYWQVDVMERRDTPGAHAVARSRSLWDETLKLGMDFVADGAVHSHQLIGPQDRPLMALERSIRVPANDDNVSVRLIVASDARELRAAIEQFRSASARYLFTLAAFLMVLLGLQLTVGLSPLRLLSRALAALRRGETANLDGVFPAEINPLVQDFNAVLDENRRVVERARTQAGNLAHAIKTPLTVLANAASDTHQNKEQLQQLIREQVGLAREQVDWHLQRARTSAVSGARPGQFTDIVPVIEGIIQVIRKAFADKNIDFECNLQPQGLRFAGEQQDFTEMLGNLIENAAKWCRSRIAITTSQDRDGRIVLAIEDDGPGLSAADRERVLERGVRADQRTPGSGLGLSIVSELVELYQGEILLDHSERLGGLRVRLRLRPPR